MQVLGIKTSLIIKTLLKTWLNCGIYSYKSVCIYLLVCKTLHFHSVCLIFLLPILFLPVRWAAVIFGSSLLPTCGGCNTRQFLFGGKHYCQNNAHVKKNAAKLSYNGSVFNHDWKTCNTHTSLHNMQKNPTKTLQTVITFFDLMYLVHHTWRISDLHIVIFLLCPFLSPHPVLPL